MLLGCGKMEGGGMCSSGVWDLDVELEGLEWKNVLMS